MAGGVNVSVLGDKALQKRLSNISGAMQKKIVRKALREGIRPVAQQARANAPVLSGLLQLSLTIRARKFKDRNKFGIQVSTDKLTGVEIFYAGFNEFGTEHQPAKPFIRPALYDNKATSFGIIKRETWSGIQQAAG